MCSLTWLDVFSALLTKFGDKINTYPFRCWGCAHCRRQAISEDYVNEWHMWLLLPHMIISILLGRLHWLTPSCTNAATPGSVGNTLSSEQAGNFHNQSSGDSCRRRAKCSAFFRNLCCFGIKILKFLNSHIPHRHRTQWHTHQRAGYLSISNIWIKKSN